MQLDNTTEVVAFVCVANHRDARHIVCCISDTYMVFHLHDFMLQLIGTLLRFVLSLTGKETPRMKPKKCGIVGRGRGPYFLHHARRELVICYNLYY